MFGKDFPIPKTQAQDVRLESWAISMTIGLIVNSTEADAQSKPVWGPKVFNIKFVLNEFRLWNIKTFCKKA